MTENPYDTPKQQDEQPSKALGDNAAVRMLLPVGRSGWAIAAGYSGIVGLTLLLAPIALIISSIAFFILKRSKKKGAPLRGMGRVIFGLIVGVVGSILFVYAMTL